MPKICKPPSGWIKDRLLAQGWIPDPTSFLIIYGVHAISIQPDDTWYLLERVKVEDHDPGYILMDGPHNIDLLIALLT